MSAVVVPLADLRKEKKNCSQDFSHDDLRNSQVLFGERIELLEQGEWNYVYVPQQGLFGWLHITEIGPAKEATHVMTDFNHALPFGSFCQEGRPLFQPLCRKQLVKDALNFLGMPYLWGGCCSHQTKPIGSVDCSGLIHLLYRAQGILIPRDSGPQCLFLKKTEKLLPGDLIYLGDPISHVIMKVDEDLFIEAPETGKSVRLLKWGRDIWEDEGIYFFDREKCYSKHYRCVV